MHLDLIQSQPPGSLEIARFVNNPGQLTIERIAIPPLLCDLNSTRPWAVNINFYFSKTQTSPSRIIFSVYGIITQIIHHYKLPRAHTVGSPIWNSSSIPCPRTDSESPSGEGIYMQRKKGYDP